MSPLIFFLYSSQIQSFRFSVSVLTPSPCGYSPPISLRHTPQCCGIRQGERLRFDFIAVAVAVFNPSVLRTPPLYFAVHNTGEGGLQRSLFSLYCFVAPAMLRDTAGRGCDLILLLLLSQFFNPLSFGHLPYILLCTTQGRRIATQSFFPILFCSAP